MKQRLTLVLPFVLLTFTSVQAQVIAIKAGKLVDPETGMTSMNQVVLVENRKIKAVGAGLQIPAGAQVIDLSNSTVLPGLFDAHTHLCLTMPRPRAEGFAYALESLLMTTVIKTTAYRALEGAANARAVLEAGFTTVRDVGNAGNYADTDLRRAIEDRLVPGPTIINAGRIIAPYGGQYSQLTPERRDIGNPEYLYADTRDELRKAIRENAHYGAKVIKIAVDDQPYIYSADDIKFIVDEARTAGLKVAAHCFTPAGAHNAAEAAVASIEHAFPITNADLALARKNNVVLVGTDFPEMLLRESGLPVGEHAAIVDRLKRAHKAGVTMAFGTDVFVAVPGQSRGALALSYIDSFVEAGVPARVILQAMTMNAAQLLGVHKDRGALKAGMAADMIATSENPLDNILTLKRVGFVMKEGTIVKHGQ